MPNCDTLSNDSSDLPITPVLGWKKKGDSGMTEQGKNEICIDLAGRGVLTKKGIMLPKNIGVISYMKGLSPIDKMKGCVG
jgi:hypothetical protein